MFFFACFFVLRDMFLVINRKGTYPVMLGLQVSPNVLYLSKWGGLFMLYVNSQKLL